MRIFVSGVNLPCCGISVVVDEVEAHFYNVSIHKAKTIFSRILKELYKRYDWRCFEQKQNYFMNSWCLSSVFTTLHTF